MNVFRKSGSLFIIFLLLTLKGWTQNEPNIIGTVIDKNNQKLLPAITIEINPGNFTTLSDSIGAFRLTGLQPGTYNLRFSGVGFQFKLLSNIVITTGNITTLNVELDPAIRELESVTVTGRSYSARAATLE